ncbi:hypothetical protein AMK05_CH03670 [Rhizobium sp. N324]|nr:hypothetical protein AMK05_CH03670 [Rhizobium sp. N324]
MEMEIIKYLITAIVSAAAGFLSGSYYQNRQSAKAGDNSRITQSGRDSNIRNDR